MTEGSQSMRGPGATWRAASLSLFAVLLLAGNAIAEGPASVFLKGPYLQAPGTNTMTVMWESAVNAPGFLRYGQGDRLNQMARVDAPVPLLAVTHHSVTNMVWEPATNQPPPSVANSEVVITTNVVKVYLTNVVFLFELTLTNLAPNSRYAYSAATAGVVTPLKHFHTFGPFAPRMRFVAYGDTRNHPKTHLALASQFERYSPDFILHMGDLVSEGKRYDVWGTEFFQPLAKVIDEVPILPAIGNHEEDGTNYLRYLHLPGRERYDSYDMGPVHVLALDYHYEKSNDEQFTFAQQDLMSSQAPWKVVMLHYPVFNIGGHGTTWGLTNYLPLFHEAKVDLVIGGHSHLYERFRPVAAASGPDSWPITYITTGGGGAPLAVDHPHPALAAHAATNHFVLIDATRTSLKGYAITTRNRVFDSFELKKANGFPPPSYYAQVYSESALKLSYAAAESLAAIAKSLPETNASAQLEFNIPAFAKADQPVTMEISLAPGSAAAYELEDRPAEVLCPPIGATNRTVTVRVRATGKKKVTVEGKEKELNPPLTFQARLMTGTVESMAYGPRCKLQVAPDVATKKVADPKPPQSAPSS